MNQLSTVTKKEWLYGGLVAVVILAIAGVVLWAPWQKSANKAANKASAPSVAVIEITSNGFVPSTLSVHTNTDIVWVNEDVAPHLPAADPYPTHSSLPALVAPRALGQKETYSFHVSHAETINYHDDLNPTLIGSVEVH